MAHPTAGTGSATGGPRRWSTRWSTRYTRPITGGWWLDGALLAAFAALTVALVLRSPLLALDTAVDDWCDAHRPYAGYLVARGLNYAGQGTPLMLLTLAVAGWRARLLRSARPLLVAVTAAALLYLVIGPVKLATGRPAASNVEVPHPERLFSVFGEMSYPSGHVANAVVWYTALVIVLTGVLSPRVRLLLRVVPAPLVIATTTYLGWHWLTDGFAGVLLGAVLARLLLRIRWDELPLGGRLTRTGWVNPMGSEPGGAGPSPAGQL